MLSRVRSRWLQMRIFPVDLKDRTGGAVGVTSQELVSVGIPTMPGLRIMMRQRLRMTRGNGQTRRVMLRCRW